jgi:hypothetical protein
MYGPNQVGDLIIGNAVASETTIQTFVATASDKELKVLSDAGVAVAANVPFKVVQKTAGDAAKGLDYEYSDIIDPKYVEKVTLKEYDPEVQKLVTVTVGATPTANTSYAVEVRLYNDGGSLSPENFAVISGYYVSGATAPSTATVRDGLLESLNNQLVRRGNSEFVTAAVSTNQITIAGKAQTVVPGKIIGKQIEFDVIGKSYPNAFDLTVLSQNTGLVVPVITTVANPGNGTGKFAINYEWFVKGNKYDPARQVGYPVDFATPYYASAAGLYNTIQIKYFTPRNETSVERQYKVLTILVDKVTDVAASNANTNTILTSIRTAVGTNATVPANLAVV